VPPLLFAHGLNNGHVLFVARIGSEVVSREGSAHLHERMCYNIGVDFLGKELYVALILRGS
jgi:hypothetical protein